MGVLQKIIKTNKIALFSGSQKKYHQKKKKKLTHTTSAQQTHNPRFIGTPAGKLILATKFHAVIMKLCLV
jgi:hypothetical protein